MILSNYLILLLSFFTAGGSISNSPNGLDCNIAIEGGPADWEIVYGEGGRDCVKLKLIGDGVSSSNVTVGWTLDGVPVSISSDATTGYQTHVYFGSNCVRTGSVCAVVMAGNMSVIADCMKI